MKHCSLLCGLTALKTWSQNFVKACSPGQQILLHGPLGVGKTALARALISQYCGPQQVISPTFNLVQHYPLRPDLLPFAQEELALWHFDFYRLQDSREIFELGWEDSLAGIALIEWPERLGNITLPSPHHIYLEFMGEFTGQSRKLTWIPPISSGR